MAKQFNTITYIVHCTAFFEHFPSLFSLYFYITYSALLLHFTLQLDCLIYLSWKYLNDFAV